MKLLTIIYDSGVDESMLQLLEGLEVPGYTRITDLHGMGGRGPKQLNPIYPGSNNMLFVAVPDEQVEHIHHAIRRFQASFRLKPGITILSQPVEELS